MGHTVSQDQSSQVFYGDRGSQVLAAKAGNVAIKKNDLVVLAGSPARIFPAETSDYAAVPAAGSSPVALTTVSATGSGPETRQRAVVDTATGDIFFADTYLTGPVGCQIWRYNSAGVLQRSMVLDSSGAGSGNQVQAMFLSNGNILVFWYNIATPYTLYFAIVDKALNLIVAKTAIASVNTNPQSNAHCIALSGGGFAVAYAHAGVGSYFTIRDNAGAVVYGPALIAGAPSNSSANANGPRFKLAQLSNGNIFVGINDTSQADGARYCIFNTAGGVVKAYTVMTGHGSGGTYYPEMSVLPGFVCMVIAGNKAYVFSEAGTLQGAPLAISPPARVINDGVHFYAFYNGLVVSRIQTTGASVSYTMTGFVGGALQADVIFERGRFLVCDSTKVYVVSIAADGMPTMLASSDFAGMAQAIGGIGDFCILGLQVGKFQITKYLNASIFGVSQSDIPAGNEGSPVTVIAGIGGYPTNGIKGTVGKAFDHTGASIVGNKGAMYLDSVLLKGL